MASEKLQNRNELTTVINLAASWADKSRNATESTRTNTHTHTRISVYMHCADICTLHVDVCTPFGLCTLVTLEIVWR